MAWFKQRFDGCAPRSIPVQRASAQACVQHLDQVRGLLRCTLALEGASTKITRGERFCAVRLASLRMREPSIYTETLRDLHTECWLSPPRAVQQRLQRREQRCAGRTSCSRSCYRLRPSLAPLSCAISKSLNLLIRAIRRCCARSSCCTMCFSFALLLVNGTQRSVRRSAIHMGSPHVLTIRRAMPVARLRTGTVSCSTSL